FFWGLGIAWLFSIIALVAGFMALNGPSALLIGLIALAMLLIIIALMWHKKNLLFTNGNLKLGNLIDDLKKVRPSFFYVRPFSRFTMAIDYLTKPRLDPQLKRWFYSGIILCLLLVQATI